MISVMLVGHDGSYGDFIQSQVITYKNIQYMIVIAGLVLVLSGALISWLVSLYGSFKIAGPLYRFVKNLEHCQQSEKMQSLRSDDALQDLSYKIIEAAKTSEDHSQELLYKINYYLELTSLPDDRQNRQEIIDVVQNIKDIERRAKVND